MRIFLAILALSWVVTGAAQVTMRDVLRQLPDTLVPYLKENARLDFIDFIESNMKAEVSNILEGKSELTKLTDHYAMLSLTQTSKLEMRLLDTTEEVDSAHQLLCIVRSYGTDICESVVDFYSLRWNKLPTADRVSLPEEMFLATLGEQEATLSIRPQCRIDAPAIEGQEELVKSSIILKWNGKTFNKY